MGYWADLYDGRMRREGWVANPQFLAALLMLDEAGLPPEGSPGVGAVATGLAVQTIAVVKALLAADRIVFTTDRFSPPEDAVLIATQGASPPDPWVLAQGTRALWVVAEEGDISPDWLEEVEGCVRALRLTRGVVRDFLRAWYRTDDVPAEADLPDVAHVDRLVWASRRPSVAGALERLRRSDAADQVAADADAEDARRGDADGSLLRVADPPRAPSPPPVVRRLSEMHGFGEARDWGVDLARDLRAWAQGELAWADVDKGVLLVGPPGCGKTTFARSLALEIDADVDFVTYADFESASGSSYVLKALARRFEGWRKGVADTGRPRLVFWDEIDSMGARGGNERNESYWTPVINGILAFLDGAVPRDGIVVVGATNFPARVDPAMRRPGRLERVVEIPLPDAAALAAMVARHLHGGDPTAPDRVAARALRGRSPADVEIACRDARRRGRRLGRAADGADVADLVEASRRQRPADLDVRISVHEAGHAVAAVLLRGIEVVAVDIDGEGEVGGKVATVPDEGAVTRATVEVRLASLLAGRAAEELLLGGVSAGASADLSAATALALTARHRWGLDGRLAFVADDESIRSREEEVEGVLDAAYGAALALVRSRSMAVRLLAARLRRERFMEGPAVEHQVRRGHFEAFARAQANDVDDDVPLAA